MSSGLKKTVLSISMLIQNMPLSVFNRVFNQTGLFKQPVCGNSKKNHRILIRDIPLIDNKLQIIDRTYAIPSFKLQHSHKITLENV